MWSDDISQGLEILAKKLHYLGLLNAQDHVISIKTDEVISKTKLELIRTVL